MNFLLPLLVGGPDMAKGQGSVKTYNNTHTRYNKPKNNKPYWIFLLMITILGYYLLALDDILFASYSFIGSFLFTGSFVLWYLDDFKLSQIKSIKYIQIFSLIIMPILFTYYVFTHIHLYIDITNNVDDKDYHLHGHVSLDEKGAKAVRDSISTLGSNVGLGASITGVAMAGSKAIAKSSIPPFQKIGMVAAAGGLGALTHMTASTANRASAINESEIRTSSLNENVNKLVNDNMSDPLLDMLRNIELTSYICIGLIIILGIQVIIRLLPEKVNLNLSKNVNFNENINKYVNKIIILNRNMSTIYTFIVIILLLYGMGLIIYIENEIYTNINMYISIHNKLR